MVWCWMMTPDDRSMRYQKVLFILGALVAFAGVGLTLAMSLADVLRGEPVHIGDAQLVAVMGGIILTSGGVFLVLTALDLGVRKNLERLSQAHMNFKPGKGRAMWRLFWPLGAVGALAGMVLCGLSAGMDILEGKAVVSIGGYQEAVMLASLAIVFMGLMFMALGTLQAAFAYDPILLQLQAFKMVEPGNVQTRPGPETPRMPIAPGLEQPTPRPQVAVDLTSTPTLYYSPDRVELGIPAPFKGPSVMVVEDGPDNAGTMPANDGSGEVTAAAPVQPVDQPADIGEGVVNMDGSLEQVMPIAHTEDTGAVEEAPVGEVTAEVVTAEAEGPWTGTVQPDGTPTTKADGQALGVMEWPSIGSEGENTPVADDAGSDEAAQPETGLIENVVERSVLDDILKNISSTSIEEIEGLPHFDEEKGDDEGMEEMEVESEVIEDRHTGTGKDVGTPATRSCPSCGQSLRTEWRMCPYCDQVLPY